MSDLNEVDFFLSLFIFLMLLHIQWYIIHPFSVVPSLPLWSSLPLLALLKRQQAQGGFHENLGIAAQRLAVREFYCTPSLFLFLAATRPDHLLFSRHLCKCGTQDTCQASHTKCELVSVYPLLVGGRAKLKHKSLGGPVDLHSQRTPI